MDDSKIFLNIISRGKTTDLSQSKSICPEIPSDPAALFGLRLRMRVKMSVSEKLIWLIRLSVIYAKVGIVEVFKISLHWFEKSH